MREISRLGNIQPSNCFIFINIYTVAINQVLKLPFAKVKRNFTPESDNSNEAFLAFTRSKDRGFGGINT